VEIRVDHKDENGIGEILVKGKNITAGYYRDIEATVDAIENGWLHTGDLGFVDEEGYVHLTGQKIMPMQY
jgi:long-chain acyl-CoA synthetase